MSKKELYVGIDIAWGEKNPSGFCVLEPQNDKLKIIDIKLLYSIDEIIDEIKKYFDYNLHVGIDAPLIVNNEEGNRSIEREFNKDFSKYKISMLPVNRKIMTKYSQTIKSELLYEALSELGFLRDYNSSKTIFEVYPHSTIAVCFNNYEILRYKRKKGRTTEFLKEQLDIYKNYLLEVIHVNSFFDTDVKLLRGKSLKEYEDMLDSLTCAYTLFHCRKNSTCKLYKLDGMDTFITPI